MLSKDFFDFFDQIFLQYATKQITRDLIWEQSRNYSIIYYYCSRHNRLPTDILPDIQSNIQQWFSQKS